MTTVYAEGSAVTCGYCGKETSVNFIMERENGASYDLKCFHRNGVCPTCGALARDISEELEKVQPLCGVCDADELAARLAEDDD